MDSIDKEIFTKNNDILSQQVLQLENLINNYNDNILIKRIRDIIIIMKKSIDENRKNFLLIYQTLNNMNIKLDFLTMSQLGPKYEIKYYPEGKYEGQLVNGRREGKGKMYYNEDQNYLGKIYDGEWKNDLREGKGIEYWKDGEKYEGYFRNDERDGKGIYYYHDGDRHEGDYRNGKKEGPGIYYYKNGDRKICNYMNNRPIGKMVILTVNGEIIVQDN